MNSKQLIAIGRARQIKAKALEVWLEENVKPIRDEIEKESRRIFNTEYKRVRELEAEVESWQ